MGNVDNSYGLIAALDHASLLPLFLFHRLGQLGSSIQVLGGGV